MKIKALRKGLTYTISNHSTTGAELPIGVGTTKFTLTQRRFLLFVLRRMALLIAWSWVLFHQPMQKQATSGLLRGTVQDEDECD